MPIVPNLMERTVLLQLNMGPAPMLDFLGAQGFRTALAGLHLGLFDVLREGAMTPRQVAARIEADERGTGLLLEALEALGYVRERNGSFENTSMTTKWIPVFEQGANFLERVVYGEWSHLEESVKSGQPAVDDTADATEEDFQGGMIAMARVTVNETVGRVKVPAGAKRLIDVGGGHGLYSIELCRKHPQLSATVFDQLGALEVAKKIVDEHGMSGRISFQAGDFWKDDLGTGYDVALLSNIVHSNQPEGNVELITHVASALNLGGLVVVLDQIAGTGAGPTAKAMARIMALNMYIASGAQTYSFDEIEGWFDKVGVNPAQRVSLRKTPGIGVVTGKKAA